jgi:hypothetical protein
MQIAEAHHQTMTTNKVLKPRSSQDVRIKSNFEDEQSFKFHFNKTHEKKLIFSYSPKLWNVIHQILIEIGDKIITFPIIPKSALEQQLSSRFASIGPPLWRAPIFLHLSPQFTFFQNLHSWRK